MKLSKLCAVLLVLVAAATDHLSSSKPVWGIPDSVTISVPESGFGLVGGATLGGIIAYNILIFLSFLKGAHLASQNSSKFKDSYGSHMLNDYAGVSKTLAKWMKDQVAPYKHYYHTKSHY